MNRSKMLLRAAALAMPAAAALAQSVDIVATVADLRGRPVPDAVVVAVPLDTPVRLPARPREVTIEQVDKEFVPKVKAVVAGTPVAFPNHDSVRHHVFSFSTPKRFELPLYSGRPSQPVVFDQPGVVVIGCNIHDWMVGYVYVSESPHVATTDAAGRATIAVPPGRYVLRAWHPQQKEPEAATRTNVDAGRGRVEVAWALDLRAEVKVRRPPAAGGQGGGY